MVREEEEEGDDEEAPESSEGEDIEAFVGLVGQPICPLRAQIDSPLRTAVRCLQAIILTLIPLTPPPNSVATIPMDWERIVLVLESPRQYTEVGIQVDLTCCPTESDLGDARGFPANCTGRRVESRIRVRGRRVHV